MCQADNNEKTRAPGLGPNKGSQGWTPLTEGVCTGPQRPRGRGKGENMHRGQLGSAWRRCSSWGPSGGL